MRPDQSRRRRSLSLSPVTVLRYRAHYKVVLFQTLNSGYPDTRLWPIFSTIYSGPIDGCGPSSLPPPEITPSVLHVSSHFSRACIPLSSYCLLSVRFSFISRPLQ